MIVDLATINFCPGEGGGKPAILEQITITDNGKYVPEAGVDGWNEIDVEVPQKEEIDLNWHIVDNGQITFNAPDGKTYKKVVMDVDVPGGADLSKIIVTSVATSNYTDNDVIYLLGTRPNITTINCPNCEYVGTVAYGNTLETCTLPKVKEIGSFAFYNCYSTSFSSVYFPVCKIIGFGAFSACANLATINFPECSIIGSEAFNRCKLTTINFPECTSIGGNAFYGCSRLTNANFPNATTIGIGAFSGCVKLNTTNFPVCKTISASGFYSCSALSSISLPECTTIGSSAFRYCSSLQNVNFPKMTNVGYYAFGNCSSLTTVSLPACKVIGSSAFYSCSRLTVASFSALISIGMYVFQNCTALNNITLGSTSVATLGANAFSGCTGLKSIYVPASLVDAYKAATNWVSLSTKIVGI